ncbi:MAG: FG-GAP-like repeat-containing protein [Leptospiraceae bacterium]|nr:FG-GAP-like repeat-containing protein [Leptospiraceae bacterium]
MNLKKFSLFLIIFLTQCKPELERSPLSYFGLLAGSRTTNSTTTTTTTPTVTPETPTITNLRNNSIVNTGFLLGTASGTFSSIEVSLDNAAYSQATGTTSWTYKLPSGSSTWKEFSKHTISVRANNNGTFSTVTTINVIQGQNKDINGDGYPDLVIANQAGTPSVFIFYSSVNGITATSSNNANSTITGTGEFGTSIALGDINGDGYADLAIGAPVTTNGNVYIFHSTGATGISSGTTANAFTNISGASAGNRFGQSVALGDVTNDGYSDLAVSATQFGGSTEGSIYLFHSTSNSSITATSASSANITITGVGVNDRIGTNLCFGDFNGDEKLDLVVAAENYSSNLGRVFIFHNSGSGLTSGTAAIASTTITGSSNNKFGRAITAIDINGDGFTDLISGSELSPADGNVRIFISPGSTGITVNNPTLANTTIAGFTTSRLGRSLSSGDLNSDGFGDIIAGGDTYSSGGNFGIGIVAMSQGSTGITITSFASANKIFHETTASQFGQTASVLDFNGDGYQDIVFTGGTNNSGLTNQGAAYLMKSSSTGIIANSISEVTHKITGGSANDLFGTYIQR